MRNIKLTYCYDGSEFYGLQRQDGFRTVQGEIEKLLRIMFKKDIDLVSAGRTDRGVHSKMQVSNFFAELPIPVDKIKMFLNHRLPKDIVIISAEEVSDDFSARFSATYRAYEYFITEEKSPFNSRYMTNVDVKLDIEKLNEIVKPLIGVHDFQNFRLADCGSQTTVREIYEAYFKRENETTVKLYVKGSAFLKSQIRIIVGTVLWIYLGKKPKDFLINMIENPGVEYAKIVAEPNGLYLCDIGY